jgi:hypothetical protein
VWQRPPPPLPPTDCVCACAPRPRALQVNESLTLAKVSGVRRLQASVVSMCAGSMADYLYAVTRDLMEHKAASFPYAAALANDCWTVIEHIDRLEKEQSAVFDEWGIDFDPLREKCMAHAQRCLDVIAGMVRKDVRAVMQRVFTREHLEAKDESQVRRRQGSN